ncbi:hypothetical protein [Nocardia sp. NBC_00403]
MFSEDRRPAHHRRNPALRPGSVLSTHVGGGRLLGEQGGGR